MLGRHILGMLSCVFLVAAVSGCEATPDATIAEPAIVLPTMPPVPNPTCAGINLQSALIRGNVGSEESPVWIDTPSSQPVRSWPTIWPNGYTAQLLPFIEIFDRAGRLVAREGSVLLNVDACPQADGRMFIETFRVAPDRRR
jgi:hypothetical protein